MAGEGNVVLGEIAIYHSAHLLEVHVTDTMQQPSCTARRENGDCEIVCTCLNHVCIAQVKVLY